MATKCWSVFGSKRIYENARPNIEKAEIPTALLETGRRGAKLRGLLKEIDYLSINYCLADLKLQSSTSPMQNMRGAYKFVCKIYYEMDMLTIGDFCAGAYGHLHLITTTCWRTALVNHKFRAEAASAVLQPLFYLFSPTHSKNSRNKYLGTSVSHYILFFPRTFVTSCEFALHTLESAGFFFLLPSLNASCSLSD